MDQLVLELCERLRLEREERLCLELEESRLRYIENPTHETTAKYARSLDDFAQVVMSTICRWL
jgi:hypothetical protein